MRDNNYINIQGWMINKLGLKCNEILLFAMIYGFSQDEESEFYGSLSYIQKALNISRPTAVNLIDGLIEKEFIERVSESHYKVVKKLYQLNNFTSKETLPVGSKETLLVASKETLPNKYNTNNNTNNIQKKKKYGKFKNVLLTEKEYKNLTDDNLLGTLETFSEGIKIKDYKYKNHNLAIRKWARNDFTKKKPKLLEVKKTDQDFIKKYNI